MKRKISPGTYRAKNGDLIHFRDDLQGHIQVDVEHDDGSLTIGDLTVLSGAVRVSDDPDSPVRHPRFVSLLQFDR